jgi:membrane-associated phospholipid phosphatase
VSLRDLGRSLTRVRSGRAETLLMAGIYAAYGGVRAFRGGGLEEGRRNAGRVLALERRLGIDIEARAQILFTERRLGMPFWNALYLASQIVVMPLTILLVYHRGRHAYPFVRTSFALAWAATLVWYSLQPVAPPRLMESGYEDTVSRGTLLDLNGRFARAFYNPVAAMPSLHVGVAPLVGWALWRLSPWPATRALGLAYPGLVSVAVVVTGNHFVLDVAGGAAVVAPAAAVARMLTGPPSSPTGRGRGAGGARTSG